MPPPYFFPFPSLLSFCGFSFYSLFMTFSFLSYICLSLKPFTSISRRQTVDVVETSVVLSCHVLRSDMPIVEAVNSDSRRRWMSPAVHCRGLHAVAWCRRGVGHSTGVVLPAERWSVAMPRTSPERHVQLTPIGNNDGRTFAFIFSFQAMMLTIFLDMDYLHSVN